MPSLLLKCLHFNKTLAQRTVGRNSRYVTALEWKIFFAWGSLISCRSLVTEPRPVPMGEDHSADGPLCREREAIFSFLTPFP